MKVLSILNFDYSFQFNILYRLITANSASIKIVLHHSLQLYHWLIFLSAFQFTAVQQQLLQYEQRIFGSNCAATAVQTFPSTDSLPSFGFGFPKPPANIPTPAFNQNTSSSIFERVGLQSFPSGFTFGGGRATEQKVADNNNTFGIIPSAGNEALMDSS